MKFATLVALVGAASAQCSSTEECLPAIYGEGACCGRLSVEGIPANGNYGAFK